MEYYDCVRRCKQERKMKTAKWSHNKDFKICSWAGAQVPQPLKDKTQGESDFLSIALEIRKSIAVLDGYQDALTCHSD